ncbi:hypothetical protein RJ639_016157 [Escallonia herrerae]|uniref:WAT1-related protein n=1 Tax=Escallonia herrerae TaxID=1293975 RepID=A0AA89AK38_9ASTE|nr:hypothetical protein RJ639_016157 [Escallonia herrerae]
MEKVTVKSARGQAKILGTLTCICGSLVFTFWKGGYLFKRFVDRPLINIYETRASLAAGKENWIKGSVLILTSYVAWSLWLILQAVVYKIYPARLSLNELICFFASLQSSLLALFLGRDPTIWRLGWNVQLLTIIYCVSVFSYFMVLDLYICSNTTIAQLEYKDLISRQGVVISALVYYLQTWCISNQGPVFAAMFSPLLLVFVGIFSAVAFAEQFHLGSLIGAFLIVVGLYCVIWGKRTDDTGSSGPCEHGAADSHSDNNPMVKIPVNDDHLHGESSHI